MSRRGRATATAGATASRSRSSRRGATLYSRRGFLAPTSPAATSPADAINRALRSPLTLNDIPLRIATWTYKEPGGSRVRLLITAEVERSEDQTLDYTAGLIVVDRNNKAIASNVEKRTLARSAIDPARAVFAGSVTIEPGTYLLRMAFADSEGRIGSIDRKIDAWQMNSTGVSVGDLLVAQAPSDNVTPIQPSIEPQVANGRLAAVMEIYAPNLQSIQGLQGTLEVVPSENARPLTSAPMEVTAGKSPEVGVLMSTLNTAALPPGRYFAKATVTQAGKPQGHIIRPFRVLPAASGGETTMMAPSALPTELLGSMLSTLPGVDRKELLEPAVLNAVLGAAEKARPAAKAALASARGGKLGPAALDALAAGDQVVAAFLRGVDLFAQGQNEKAMQQLQLAMQGAPNFAPARLYLGAALAQSNRYREAASLLQSVTPDVAGPAPIARMTGLSWLRAGDANLAIAAFEKHPPAAGDTASTRTLALAYVVGESSGGRVAAPGDVSGNEPERPGSAPRRDLCELRDARAVAARGHARRRPHASAGVGQDLRVPQGDASGACRRLDVVLARCKMNRTLHSFRRPAALVLVFAAAALASPGAQERRLITETDLLKFVWIADPQISPDGVTVAFVRVTANEQKDDYETSVWVVPTHGGEPARPLTSGTRDTSPRWAPDGRRIVFARSVEREGRPQPPQLHLLSLDGGEARPLTDLARGAPRRSGRRTVERIAFASTTRSDDTAPAATTTATPPKKSDVRVITSATYRSNGGGWNDPERPSHLWAIDVPAGPEMPKPLQLTDGTFSEGGHVWSTDGSRIFFVSTRVEEPYFRAQDSDLFAVPSRGGAVATIASIDGSIGNPSVSPDGRSIAFIGTLSGTPERSYSQSDLFVADLSGGSRLDQKPDRGVRLRHRRRHWRRSGGAARRRIAQPELGQRRPIDRRRGRRTGRRESGARGCRRRQAGAGVQRDARHSVVHDGEQRPARRGAGVDANHHRRPLRRRCQDRIARTGTADHARQRRSLQAAASERARRGVVDEFRR